MKCRITNNAPTAAQRRVLKNEVSKEFCALLDRYNRDAALQVAHVLHFQFGFGQARLERFAEHFNKMQAEQVNRYELQDEDTPWLCEKQLTDDGINVKILLGE